MFKLLFAMTIIVATSNTAIAGCELVSGPCSTDRQGNSYRTEQNLGGGYTTHQNGRAWSQTGQTLSGSWREQRRDGSERTYNYDPYESARERNRQR